MINEQKNIIGKCIKGDRTAQKNLYLQYADKMLNVAYRILKNREDARDILQEAFIKVFRNLHQFKFNCPFEHWLKKIVINTSISFVRKKGIDIISDLEKVELWYFEEEKQQDEVYSDWNVKIAQAALMQLPRGYRTVLSLYLIEGYDHSEIAEILGISKSTSLTQFKRGKEKLRTLVHNIKVNRHAKY